MDARITGSRLSNLLAYDWLKIIITIVVAVFFGVVVLSMIGTRATYAQQIHLMFYKDLYVSGEFSDTLENESNDVFSYEVFSADYFTMSSDSTYSDMALSARYAAGQRSMMFSSTLIDSDSDQPYIDEVVSSCYPILENLDDYLSAAEEYADSFYGGDYINGTLDEEYLSEQFKARVKGDKRYKTEQTLLAGVEDEKERIASLRSSIITISTALEEGVIEKYYVSVEDGAEGLPYAYKLGTKKMTSLVDLIYTYEADSEVKTSDGICVCVYTPVNESCAYMRYESLNYIAYLINTYAAA